jgi:Flp pilus assembly protein TadD
VIAIAIYLPSMNGPFILDDQSTVIHNQIDLNFKKVLGYTLLEHIRERTFSQFTFYLQNATFDNSSPAKFRLVNYGLHLINGVLLYLLVILLFKAKSKQSLGLIAGLAALVFFLMHPIQTQAVNYITQRMILLATEFSLGALIVFLKLRNTNKPGFLPWFQRITLFALILLALLSKPTAICLFPILLFVELIFVDKLDGKSQWVSFLSLLTFVIISVGISFDEIIDTPRITPIEYLLTQAVVVIKYIGLILWPTGLSLDHNIKSWPEISHLIVIGSALFHACLITIAWLSKKTLPIISLGIITFYLSLFPESGLIPLKDLMTEHRTYLAMVGTSIIVAGIASRLAHRKWALPLLGTITVMLISLTTIRNLEWRSEQSLWSSTLKSNSSSARALYSLGRFDLLKGDTASAVDYFEKAISANGQHVPSKSAFALILIKQGNYIEAAELLEYALELEPNDVTTAQNLGYLMEKEGKLRQALRWYRKALRNSNGNSELHLDFGTVYLKLNNSKEAVKHLLKAAPHMNSARLYNNLGYAYQLNGDLKSAEINYKKSLMIDSNYNVASQNLKSLSEE